MVEDLEIRGHRTVSRDVIMKRIKTRPGMQFSRRQADTDLANVLKIGVFDKEESKLFIETGAKGGVVVIFALKEVATK
jgi:hypothetical protein